MQKNKSLQDCAVYVFEATFEKVGLFDWMKWQNRLWYWDIHDRKKDSNSRDTRNHIYTTRRVPGTTCTVTLSEHWMPAIWQKAKFRNFEINSGMFFCKTTMSSQPHQSFSIFCNYRLVEGNMYLCSFLFLCTLFSKKLFCNFEIGAMWKYLLSNI